MDKMKQDFIVSTRINILHGDHEKILDFARRSIPIFSRQPGFLGLTQHLSQDSSHILTYIKWRRQEDHEACLTSPDFAELNLEWKELMDSGKIDFQLHTYKILDFMEVPAKEEDI